MAERQSTMYIVDDEESIRDSLGSLLRSVGFHVEVFSSTNEFLNFTRHDTPSCLVLDVRLPDSNGIDFQDQLKKIGIDIPIVFITGHGDIPMTSRAIKAGAVEFLTKPFQKNELLDAINQGLERDRRQRLERSNLAVLRERLDKLTPREREVMDL